MLTRLRHCLRYLWNGARIDRELADELEFHRAMLARDEERRGHSPSAAAVNASRRMGNTTLMTEYSREAWMVGWLDTLARDVRYALRSFARNPTFTIVAILTLGLGIGANTAIFRLVDAVMLRSLPIDRPSELVAIRGTASYWEYEQIRDRNDVFTGVMGVRVVPDVTMTGDQQNIGRGSVELVTGNYFSFLGVRPILGRPVRPDDDRSAGAGPVAVISYGLWTRAFGASTGVLGRTIRLRGGRAGGDTSGFEPDTPHTPRETEATLTIVGVAPPEFFGDTVGKIVDVWLPITMQPVLMPGRMWLTRQTASWVGIMGRRKPGVTEAQAAESLTLLTRQLQSEELGPAITEEQKRNMASSRVVVDPGAKGFTQLRREFSQPLLVLMTVVTLVLLIACLNVANLLLARATARRQEIAMRQALGAGRMRLVRQLLTESLLLAGAGGLLGLALATIGAKVLVSMVSSEAQSIAIQLDPDARILAFTFAVSVASGLVLGLIPAVGATRRDLQTGVKESSSRAAGRTRAPKMLVGAQVAVSLVLLVGCGLFLRTLYNLQTVALGYDLNGLIMVRVDPVAGGYKGDDVGRAIVELMHRLNALPGVRSVAFSENGLFNGVESGTSVEIAGYTPLSPTDRNVRFDQAGPGYFTKVGIPLVLGRDFTERDGPGAPRVTIINDTMARFYFPQENPIGRRIRETGPSDAVLEIVGIAHDAQDHDLRDKPVRRMYVSYLQPIDGIVAANFEIRSASPAGAPALFGLLREEIQRFNPQLPILSVKMARSLVDDSIPTERLIAKLSTVFGVLAALLAAIGLYGVMSYTVARRRSEIGVRIALGARPSEVARMILREVLLIVGAGSAAGAMAAIALAHFVESLVFGLAARDPLTVIASVLLFAAIGLLAGYLPARRAARIDPVVALRAE